MRKTSLRRLIIRKDLKVSLGKSAERILTLWFRCKFRDEFEANLPRVIHFLKRHGVPNEDVYRITAIVGELGNNTFDHNVGKWPNGFIGNFVALGYNKKRGRLIEVVVIDFGIGFKESLVRHHPSPKTEVEAIQMGLAGASGRIGEKRGNGLRTVVAWMRKYYSGRMRIQSNEGVIVVQKNGQESGKDKKIIGTEVYLRLRL